jgi:hypothetical protein
VNRRETKAQRFTRIAERRVNETLRAFRLLGNLSERRNYEYSEEQVQSMFLAIDREYQALRTRFMAGARPAHEDFSFDEKAP